MPDLTQAQFNKPGTPEGKQNIPTGRQSVRGSGGFEDTGARRPGVGSRRSRLVQDLGCPGPPAAPAAGPAPDGLTDRHASVGVYSNGTRLSESSR